MGYGASSNMTCTWRPARWKFPPVEAALEPVGLEEMKAHGVYDFADDDALVAGYIKAGRQWVENYTNSLLISRTVVYSINSFPRTDRELLELPGGKVQSVTSIAYTDPDGASQTWSASEYSVDTGSVPGRIGCAYGYSWPSTRDWDYPVVITYVAGYGSAAGDVPEPLRLAVKLAAAAAYEQREPFAHGQVLTPAYFTPEALCMPYRTFRVV